MADGKTLTIPMPAVAPTGFEIDNAQAVHPVWDMVISEQNGRVQSIEDRMLMAMLRAVHEGLNRVKPCATCTPEPSKESA